MTEPIRIHVSSPSLTSAEEEAVAQVVRSGRITQGAKVAEFEQLFSEYHGGLNALACSSGTAALHLAIKALGIGPGDEVIVPNVSFVATANAVLYVGAKPVLCDISPHTWGLSAEQVRNLITTRTKAIIAVHLYGVPCDIIALSKLAKEYGLYLIEDVAEGFTGRAGNGQQLGTFGDTATFSFYGNKIITTGEGGMVLTRHRSLCDVMYLLRGQNMSPDVRYFHYGLGFNYRMTDIQAALGVVQMKRLPEILTKREAAFNVYDALLGCSDWPLGAQMGHRVVFGSGFVAPWLYTIEFRSQQQKDKAVEMLDFVGVETRPVFLPMSYLPHLEDKSSKFPNSLNLSNRGLSLPTHTDLQRSDMRVIAGAVLAALDGD